MVSTDADVDADPRFVEAAPGIGSLIWQLVWEDRGLVGRYFVHKNARVDRRLTTLK